MGFGVNWSSGLGREFEIIDFGFNTATDAELTELRDALAAWGPNDPNRARLMDLQRKTILSRLYELSVPPDAPQPLVDLRAKNPDKVAFDGAINAALDHIQQSWFGRQGQTQWIKDARLRPVEIEALMVKAKLEVCNHRLAGVSTCRWRGQCEWPEFSVSVTLDPASDTVEVWVFGPDNASPSDEGRNTAKNPGLRMEGTPELKGSVAVSTSRQPVSGLGQVVPYVPNGEIRATTELRWLPGQERIAAGTAHPLMELSGPIPSGEDPAALEAELKRVQGNILKPHGRERAAQVLVRFGNDVAKTRKLLASVGVTSAYDQRAQADAFRKAANQPKATDPPLVAVGLSAAGLRKLGERVPADSIFRRGMAQTRDLVADPPIDAWQDTLQGELHALVIVAHTTEATLAAAVKDLTDDCARAGAQVVSVEWGKVLRNGKGRPTEHFGFADTISQPLFFESDVAARAAAGEDRLTEWELGFSPREVLVADEDGYGSYLVFRKLEQDVQAFEALQRHLNAQLGGGDAHAGAQLIGRYANGTPLLPPDGTGDPTGGPPLPTEARFGYGAGAVCPVGAHVRRVNARTGAARKSVMARRGMPYDERDVVTNEPPSGKVGLLFMACVWDLLGQFVQVQANAVLPCDGGSPDPILGGGAKWWADPTGTRPSADLGHAELVRMLGGEYFYLPPPAFFAKLG